MEEVKQFINLIVVNVRALEIGLTAKISFDESGGSLGSNAEGVDWYLRDEKDSIAPVHCEICLIDDAFCLKDVSGKTYINGSSMPLGINNYARLADEDVMQVGNYEIRMFLNREVEHKESSYSLEQLFTNPDIDLLDAISLLTDESEISDEELEAMERLRAEQEEEVVNLDPLLALELETADAEEEDDKDNLLKDEKVESLLDDEQQELLNHISQRHVDPDLDYIMQADSEQDISSAIKVGMATNRRHFSEESIVEMREGALLAPQISQSKEINKTQVIGNDPMDDNILDLLEQEVAKSYVDEDTAKPPTIIEKDVSISSSHVLGGPMINGLGVDIASNSSVEDMQRLSAEIGMTIKACVQGLLDLHTQVKDSRYGVMHRSLQPIEDNPLRLGMSYHETVRVMFDEEKSMVHLSAAASVEESMNLIRAHNDAVQYATNSALEQILQALSPDALLKRFERYSRQTTDDTNESDESWAWKMYQNYYKELTSNRQQGFEKLFWEIFEQSYDKKVREKYAE